MSLTRHVYSYHIDIASLKWWKTLDKSDQDMLQKAVYEAAVYQRADNRSKNAARLKLLKSKGMQIIENPDVDAFRVKVTDLKNMDLYKDSKVQDMLLKIMEAVR